MTRTVMVSSSDADAAADAAALLEAAETLDVPTDRIKTTTAGARVAFSVPTAVYTEAGLAGGTVAPDDFDDQAAEGEEEEQETPVLVSVAPIEADPTGGDVVTLTGTGFSPTDEYRVYMFSADRYPGPGEPSLLTLTESWLQSSGGVVGVGTPTYVSETELTFVAPDANPLSDGDGNFDVDFTGQDIGVVLLYRHAGPGSGEFLLAGHQMVAFSYAS